MHVVHPTSSTFFGGPERQMLGLARHLSAGQAEKVRRAGVPPTRIRIIRNSARLTEAPRSTAECRAQLQSFFDQPSERLVVSAGRLSPEKGFQILIEAARIVIERKPGT